MSLMPRLLSALLILLPTACFAQQVKIPDTELSFPVERKLKLDNLYGPENAELLHHIHQALRAHTLYKRGEKYLIEEGDPVEYGQPLVELQ